MQKRYQSIELFAGAGGLALGLEQAGFDHRLLIEYDKWAAHTLRHNRPEWDVLETDITTLDYALLSEQFSNESVDLLSGGYPCQAFSYAGKKLGLNDTRGTLFYSYAKVLEMIKPKIFLAENVRGLLSHDKGRTLATMVTLFSQVGYTVDYKILNAWHFGSAQKRERLVIIGVRNDLHHKANYTFPIPLETRKTLRDVLQNVPKSEYIPYSEKKAQVFRLVPPGGCWRNLPSDIAEAYMGKSFLSEGGRTGIARRLSWDEPALTVLCTPAQKQTERCHPDEIRPFTVRENARIQDFPDSWRFMGSTAQQYKQIGNAVPVTLAKSIGESIHHFLDTISHEP
ncbi:DNA (cytosine-5-)-methyltransferase [Entomospira entomophila]|uniref:DNA cytosine methyltransferase n=1 Tax=Entomospira entomophila TaxID=2719988 RepID=UPI001BAF233A|nr:DNA (cytosine-5-)-methyltransferase [Entomospira entomophilus]WDI35588.1 DNA (cytosine-5-)-methyltransferase [Entomospira entomophilus]